MSNGFDNEKAKKRFEEDLEILEEELFFNSNNIDNQNLKKYQTNYKKLYTSLLISGVIFAIILIGMWFYASNTFQENSESNEVIITRMIQFAVNNYYNDKHKYPLNSQGYIDINLLKNKGYLNADVEVYKSKFTLNSKKQVVPKID